MTFHADYWVAVAAASPVIALATAVSYGETLHPVIIFKGSTRRTYRRSYRLALLVNAVLSVIMALQAGTLFDALQSLALDRNASSIWFSTSAETFSLVALFGVTGLSALLRMLAAEVAEYEPGRRGREGRSTAGA